MPLTIQMEIFANTGVNIRFEPVAKLDGTVPLDEKTEARIKANEVGISDKRFVTDFTECAKTDECDWEAVKDKPWLRYRIGKKSYRPDKGDPGDVAGLWIAVETNIGDYSRSIKTIEMPANTTDQDKFNNLDRDQIPSPYRFRDMKDLPNSDNPVPDKHELSLEKRDDENNSNLTCPVVLDLIWKRPNATDPIDVEFIIDFGNTRTSALKLEVRRDHNKNVNTKKPEEFSVICGKVLLQHTRFDDAMKAQNNATCSDAITESWFLLKEPFFSNFADEIEEPIYDQEEKGSFYNKKSVSVCKQIAKRIPQLFVRLSPAIFGEEAKNELHDPYVKKLREKGAMIMQSSPKRYYWDKNPINPDMWNMILKPSNDRRKKDPNIRHGIPKLSASILRLMSSDARDWNLNDPPTSWAEHLRPMTPRRDKDKQDPRCNTMTWMLTAILECAWSQLNAGLDPHLPFVNRRLSRVVATYPSGWSKMEIEDYKKRWQEALNIFHLTNNPPNSNPPSIELDLDEAVASQLPVIFSGITQMRGGGDNYFDLLGRKSVDGTPSKLRAMNIDIGGGTTDISIIEYHDEAPGRDVALHAKLLFKTSFMKAGDELVKEIISKLIIPVLCENKVRDAVSTKLTDPQNCDEQCRRATHVRLVLIPLATAILAELGANSSNSFSLQEIGIDENSWNEFNQWLEGPAIQYAAKLPINYDLARKIIREFFEKMALSVAKYVAAFDVDLMIMSGKPTELPEIHELFRKNIPLPSHKIVSSKGFRTGKWYPFKVKECIGDAKSVTVVGAALSRALKSGLIQGWSLNFEHGVANAENNVWGVLNEDLKKIDGKPFLSQDANISDSVNISINRLIGKAPEHLKEFPQPVFRLKWSKGQPEGAGANLSGLKFKRNTDAETETIAIDPDSKITCNNKQQIQVSQLTLALEPTWDARGFWMDTGRLDEIDWEFIAQQ